MTFSEQISRAHLLYKVGCYNILVQEEMEECHKDSTLILHCYNDGAPHVISIYFISEIKMACMNRA